MYVWGLLVSVLLRVGGFGGFVFGYDVWLLVGFCMCLGSGLFAGWFSCYFNYIAQFAALI